MKTGTGNLILGGLLVLLGILFLLNSLGVASFDFGDFISILWPIILIIIGVRVLRGSGFCRRELPVGVTPKKQNKFIGEMTFNAKGTEIDGWSGDLFIGEAEIDLTGAKLHPGENVMSAETFIGSLTVKVPKEMKCKVVASTTAGELRVMDRKSDGISLNLEHEDEGYSEAEEKIKIFARAFVGEVKVLAV